MSNINQTAVSGVKIAALALALNTNLTMASRLSVLPIQTGISIVDKSSSGDCDLIEDAADLRLISERASEPSFDAESVFSRLGI